MKLNPKTMSWQAPAFTTNGTPIDYELEYEVGLLTAESDPLDYDPLVTIPGQLREGDTYEAPISDLPLEDGENTIALRSFKKEQPELLSEWSNPVTFELQAAPSAPLELRVT